MDLLIKNARLRGIGRICDIEIDGGKIAGIVDQSEHECETTIDAQGKLVTEPFANPHLHLCKAYTLHLLDSRALTSYHGQDMGAAMTAIELAARVKEKYHHSWIAENARRALSLAALHGCLYIRAFADVDRKAKLEGVEALLEVREEFSGTIDVQIVAFPQDGVIREPGTEDLIREAMILGANVVGGIPWIEFTDNDCRAHVDKMCAIAREFDKDVSMLVDDAGDAGLRTLEMFAVKMIEDGRIGRGLAHHARAMSLYPEPYFRKLSAILKKAEMGLVSDPHTGPLHARVKEMLVQGNLVAFGQDDIADAYYPFGQNNMLEVGFLNAHLLWMTTFPEMEQIYDMITVKAARCMNVHDLGVKAGSPANLVVLNARSVHEAIWYHEKPRYVIRHGKVLDTGRFASYMQGDESTCTHGKH